MSSSVRIVPAERHVEGAGFVVHRPFPVQGLSYFDPFLLIDEMGPIDYAPGEAQGAPDHPHRGFETITYLLAGEMEHEDSFGHRGRLQPGDVQWMTAGAGVIHSEMPSAAFQASGGRMHGFQIWVNLPRERKMMTPRYQEFTADKLPVAERDGAWIRVIAGTADGVTSPIQTEIPVTMLHLRLRPGASATTTIAPGSNAIVHVMAGATDVLGRRTSAHQDALVAQAPTHIRLRAEGDEPFEALLLACVPINEPVVRYGPFVMNTVTELQTAFDDFQAGRFGEIARVVS